MAWIRGFKWLTPTGPFRIGLMTWMSPRSAFLSYKNPRTSRSTGSTMSSDVRMIDAPTREMARSTPSSSTGTTSIGGYAPPRTARADVTMVEVISCRKISRKSMTGTTPDEIMASRMPPGPTGGS